MRPVDWLLLAVCGALVLAGPAMALQEFARHQERAGLGELTGDDITFDAAFRAPWRTGLLVAVILGGIAGTIIAVRVAAQPKVRSVSGRLLFLLLAGMTLLDVGFLVDGRMVDASYLARGATTVWVYPIAGILMAGATMRLAELEDAFA